MTDIQLARSSLGFFPTPTVRLNRLTEAVGGAEIYIKRDDLTGLALGGNKTRKLEYILADALAQGCDTIITAGAAQSNHCRQTAAAAAYLGLACHLVLGGEAPTQATGNLLLDQLFGSQIHWAGEHRKGEDIPALQAELAAAGHKPYVVPYGGSNELGAVAFLQATRELLAQTAEPFTHIVFASSSGGTQAGLMLGKVACDQHYQVTGINIDKGESGDQPFATHVLELANRTALMLGMAHQFAPADVVLNDDYLGDGYAVVGAREREAILLTARTEGILLDPVYTGRAMGGLLAMLRSEEIAKDARVLFWHTGGAPALFAYADSLAPL
jgi:L-cysteate sulfo-lyase